MSRFSRKQDESYREAASLLAEGKAQDAIDRFREILRDKPNHYSSLIAIGVALIQVQETPSLNDPRTDEAFRYLDQAVSMDKKNPVPIFNKGVILRNIGMFEEALEIFDQVLAIEKKNPLAVLHKAEINYELERWEESLVLAKLALARDPGLEGSMGWVRDAMRKAGFLDDDGNAIRKVEEEPDEYRSYDV